MNRSAECRTSSVAAVHACIALTQFLCWSARVSLGGETWVEDSREDFADGTFDAAGENLYVTADGTVRTIHRFDLNADGYIDLVFNSTHDTYTEIPATLAIVSQDDELVTSDLAVLGSRHAAFGDLNLDGHADVVYVPNLGGAQDGRHMLSIQWGGEDGWTARRRSGALPVHAAKKVVVADVNIDSWPDIVTLNGAPWEYGQPAGNIVRIYWGGPEGYLLTKRYDLGVPDAIDLTAGDFDADGSDDVAVLTTQPSVEILWATPSVSAAVDLVPDSVALPDGGTCVTSTSDGADRKARLVIGTQEQQLLRASTGAGRIWKATSRHIAANATHVSAGDLNGDGLADVVLTEFAPGRAGGGELGTADPDHRMVTVVWGSEDGFTTEGSQQLPVASPAATAIGDLNADGHPDVAVAVYQGAHTFTTDSAIFLGDGNGHFRRCLGELPTTGAMGVAIASAGHGQPARAVFCNSVGGTLKEEVPLQIYWGAEQGFDPTRVTEIPFASGYESSAADLNNDGFVDLVELNSGHSGATSKDDPTLGISIFWGAVDGFDFSMRRTVLHEENLGTSSLADLNRDGYLDIVVGQFAPSSDKSETQVIVYYGGEEGFLPERRVTISSPGRSIGTVVADFNQDNWLDLAVSSFTKNQIRIFWGSEQGFDAGRHRAVAIDSPIDIGTADLNQDGFQDLIVGTYEDPMTRHRDLGTHILWGGADGFAKSNSQWLPGYCPIRHCVSDFDADGYLDLFSPHYHANGTRESLPCYLYWGGEQGYSEQARTSLICDSAHDGLAGDFNHDGLIDLAVVCHARDSTHTTVSRVFYNDARRFSKPRIQELPTHGPHWMWHGDMGHIAHRRWEQLYESSVHHLKDSGQTGRIELKADVPAGASLETAVRSAVDAESLVEQPWRSITDSTFTLDPQDRVLQYAIVFRSTNGDRYPALEQVKIDLN